MTMYVPSTDELRAFCFQLVEAAWAEQRTPWRRWPADDGAELLNRLAYHNLTGPRWQRLQRMRCLLYTSPSPRDRTRSRMPSSA